MKIYDFGGAPNPKKLRVFLAEKGIDGPDRAGRHHQRPEPSARSS